MGEERRRKLAGTYPNLDDPMEQIRRFWCGRGPVPVEDFVVPGGTVAVTFDVAGVEPWSSIIDATKVVEAVERFQKIVGDKPYRPFIRDMGREMAKAKRNNDTETLESSGIMGAWSAFYHPEGGQQMREAVSTMLRQTGKAHITWRYSPTNGLALALSEKFVDLEEIAAQAPPDGVVTYNAADDEPPPRQS
jgi:hypothetical protein